MPSSPGLSPLREMPIIAVTGHADVALTVEAIKAGAIEFFSPPLPSGVHVTVSRPP